MAEICPECGATFGSAADLVEHSRSDHRESPAQLASPTEASGPIWLRCALCGARFRSPEALAEHNARPHPSRLPSRWPGAAMG